MSPASTGTQQALSATRSGHLPLTHPRLPRWAPWLVAAVSASAAS